MVTVQTVLYCICVPNVISFLDTVLWAAIDTKLEEDEDEEEELRCLAPKNHIIYQDTKRCKILNTCSASKPEKT